MKKYALLASLGLILFMSSCTKDDLGMEIENMNLELTNKDKDKPKDDEWDKHSKDNGADSTLNVTTVFSDGKH